MQSGTTFSFTTPALPPVITSATEAAGNVGSPFSYQITATNQPAGFFATNLPAGLSLNTSTGLISGTPTTVGVFYPTISAENSGGLVTVTLLISISGPIVPVINSPLSAPQAQAGYPFSYQITATNNPTGFNATGLPAGLQVSASSGLISAAPRSAAPSP